MTASRNDVAGQLEQARSQAAALQAQAQAAARASRSQIVALQSQNATLQTTLAWRTAERDAARAQAAALQAELDAVPAPLDVAVEQVRREVAWARHGTHGSTSAPHGPSSYSVGRLTAVSALNCVVGHVSASAYGYLQVTDAELPAAAPDSVLAAQAASAATRPSPLPRS